MGVIALTFGVAAVAAVAVSRLAGRRHASFKMALMLLAFWAIANLMPAWVDPILDVVGFYAAFFVAFERPKCRWCWGILAAFAAQLFVHAAFLLDGDSYWRMVILNALFAVELICVTVPGGIVGLRHLRDSRSGDHPAGAGARGALHPQPQTRRPTSPARTLKVAAPTRHKR